jgi:hypothetical protein
LKPPEEVSTVNGWVANWQKTHQGWERLGTSMAFVMAGETEDKNSGKELSVEEKLKKIRCFRCKEKGHIALNCPQKNKMKEQEGVNDSEQNINATWVDADVFTSFDIYNATKGSLGLGTAVVLLDTQANISLFHPSVVENMEGSEK